MNRLRLLLCVVLLTLPLKETLPYTLATTLKNRVTGEALRVAQAPVRQKVFTPIACASASLMRVPSGALCCGTPSM